MLTETSATSPPHDSDRPADSHRTVGNGRSARWTLPRRVAFADPAAWPRAPLVVAARAAAQVPLRLLLTALAPITVGGRTALDGLAAPALFVANHASHLDTPVLLAALPARWRRRVTVAAAADYFFSRPWFGVLVAFLFNAFPFSRTTAVRTALTSCAALLNRGWSVLLYPEGTRSPSGRIAPFRRGVGLLACRLGVPVVPVWIGGASAVWPRGRRLPRPGRVAVRFGPPLRFPPGTSAEAATAAIEEAVRALATGEAPTPAQEIE